MEIRILLLFFLLTVLAADVIAFRKSLRGPSRVFSGGPSRGSSSRGSSCTGNFGHESSSSGGSSYTGSFGHESSSSQDSSSGGSSHTGSFGHESSSSRHRIGSNSTGTSSSQTVHHWNNDTSTFFSHAERGGPTTPCTYPGSQIGKPDFTTENKQKDVPYKPSAPSTDHLSKASVIPSQSHVPTSFGQPNAPYNPSHGTQNSPSWSNPHFNPNQSTPNIGFKDHLRPNAMPGSSYTPASPYPRPNYPIPGSNQHSRTYPSQSSGHSIQSLQQRINRKLYRIIHQHRIIHKPYSPYNPYSHSVRSQTIGHSSSRAAHIPPPVPVPTSSGQPNPSHGAQNNSSRSNSHFSPKQPTPNIGFKDRPNTMPDSSYTPASPYPPRTSYPIPGSNQHSPPYPIHPSGHSMNQSYPPYILSHSVPSQTIGHPSSYPAHIPSPVPGTFGNPYSTHPVDETYGPTGHSYPQQHVMAKPAAQPYIPGQTVIMVPGQQDSGGGFGQMVKEALVFSTVNAGVNRLINPYPHYVSNSRPADPSSAPSESHVTYNNNYYYPPGNPPSGSTSSNVPQGNVPVTHSGNYPAPLNDPAITPGVSIPTIVGNNSSVTSSTSNGSSVNTTNNMGGSSNGFSAGNSTAGTVNDQGTIVYSPQYKISDNDLSMLTEELFAKQDFNVSKYLTLHLQSKSENVTDAARGPLIYVDPELYDYPTISVIRALYDNYEHNSSVKENRTFEKRKKEDLLLNVFLNTNILTRAMQWLSDRGFIDPDDFEKKDTLRNIWFSQFNGATSGFERVFTSERYGVDLLGVQDWLYFNYQESKGRIDYMGYVDTLKLDNRTSLLKLNFKMDDIIRPNATIFVGTLPELEMSLYTICFYARPNDLCPVSLGGTKFNIFTHSFRYYGRDLIDLALPIF